MKYQQQISVGGKWAKASELVSGSSAEIISETNPQPSQFKNKDGSPKTQDVCRVQFEGLPEPVNVSLNQATINGLVGAFGEESADWQKHTLTVETEKVRVAGKAVVALYLVPEGYIKADDDNGYVIIIKAGEKKSDDDLTEDDLPPIE